LPGVGTARAAHWARPRSLAGERSRSRSWPPARVRARVRAGAGGPAAASEDRREIGKRRKASLDRRRSLALGRALPHSRCWELQDSALGRQFLKRICMIMRHVPGQSYPGFSQDVVLSVNVDFHVDVQVHQPAL